MTSYAAQKHEPKTMKAKADLMLKRGSISEAQHKKLHAKADVEIAKAKPSKAPPFKAKLAPQKAPPSPANGPLDDDDEETGTDTAKSDDPSLKRGKPGAATVTRGEPADPDL